MNFVPSLPPKQVATAVVATAFLLPVLLAGCAAHVRVYDPYYRDYHGWNGEVVYYNQWERDTHRDHRDFDHRSKEEQQDYWRWRHDHGDRH